MSKFDDSYLDSLSAIENSIKCTNELIQQLVDINLSNYKALRELKCCIKHEKEVDVYEFKNPPNLYLTQNILLTNIPRSICIEYVKKIADAKKCNLHIEKNVYRKGDLAASLTNAKGGDIIFLDITDPRVNSDMINFICEAIENMAMKVTIGERTVTLDLPMLQFAIFSEFAEHVPEDISRYLSTVK